MLPVLITKVLGHRLHVAFLSPFLDPLIGSIVHHLPPHIKVPLVGRSASGITCGVSGVLVDVVG